MHKAINKAVNTASKRYREILAAHDSLVSDRISQAFRTDAAKAAKQAAARNAYEDAIFWYDEAIKVDAGNSALLDRYAFFLSVKGRDNLRAFALARQACEIAPSDPECHFTAGCIAASLGDVPSADRYLGTANDLGFAPHRCELHRARARVRAIEFSEQSKGGKPTIRIPRSEIMRHIEGATLSDATGYLDGKHMDEVDRLRTRVAALPPT